MRMSHPSLGHQSTEDCEFRQWEDGGGVGIRIHSASDVFCAEKDPGARTDLSEPLPICGETSELEASGPVSWWYLEVVWKPFAETPLDGSGSQGTFSLLSRTLPQKATLSFNCKIFL